MALLGNYNLFNKAPLRHRGGATLADSRSNYSMSGSNRNQLAGAYPSIASTPNGYAHPFSWIMAKTTGGMSSYNQLSMNLNETLLSLAGGVNLESTITGIIDITQGQLDQIANLLSAMSANITITDAQLAAISALEAAITASMTVTDAQMGAIIDLAAALSAQISTTNAGNFATADISADMSLTSGAATPSDIANEVFDNQDIETGYSFRKSLRLILSSLSGKLSGAGTSTVTIRNVTDTKDRITATVDSNGNRLSVTTDVS